MSVVEDLLKSINCKPINKASDIENCLLNPPQWIEKVIPLCKRSKSVIKNNPVDCHTSEGHFYVRNRFDTCSMPKTLVCHDYKGGYLTDSYVPLNIENERNIAKEGYTFYNWSQIDYFVYFSHHFITIPPLSWINVAHKNGVKVLGTIITEFNDGAKICDEEIFNNRDSMREFAYNLSELLKIFRFDGWLLNIENEVQHPDILKEFVEVLTKKIHEEDNENIVLWYDSVTEDGKLKWQDELNSENKCFFDLCDGIFLNYCWDEKNLADTVELAGCRRFDVFVGIDIFGRNMFGGGQFNTFKAVELISKYNLSMALFAPAWSYETLEKLPQETTFSRFLTRDDTLWSSLWPYLYTHPLNNLFSTNFHVGFDSDMYSLFVQEQQISRIIFPDSLYTISDNETILSLKSSCDCLKRGYVQAKNACLISNKNIKKTSANILHNIFACDIQIQGKIAVFIKTEKVDEFDSSVLELNLLTSLESGNIRKVKLLGEKKNNTENNMSILEVNPMLESEIKQYINLDTLQKKHNYSKSLTMYQFSTTKCTLLEIGATLINGHSIFLTDFGIFNL